ncbi:MAG TPA: DUF177 domain-containing protein [Trueperaceae bacterium]|nr:DUF177 domain-containing protein [Trueperaceae bacterium]
MVSRRDALLNLAPLLNRAPGSPDEVTGEGLLEPEARLLEADGLTLEGPLGWEVTVRNAGGDDDFIVQGSVSGIAVLECRRCLTSVPTEARADFFLPMEYRAREAHLRLDEVTEDDEELLLFGHPEVDFAGLLAQLFAIELPITVVCREGCKGLSLDGVNLNEHPELEEADREQRASESPFEALKDLDLSS